eukprot:361269-Rhodomonas_salina.1
MVLLFMRRCSCLRGLYCHLWSRFLLFVEAVGLLMGELSAIYAEGAAMYRVRAGICGGRAAAGIAYAAVGLRACYAMSGTGIAYAAASLRHVWY